jgi:hypothetical protein
VKKNARRLVRSDLFANACAGELGHPGEKRRAVKKSLFCHGIEVDLIVGYSKVGHELGE